MNIVVTGGAGFIGSALCRRLLETTDSNVTVIDKLTYAASPQSLPKSDRLELIKADICDTDAVNAVFQRVRPRRVFNLAAETHVDRSITASDAFIQSNIVGVHRLLEAARGIAGDDDFRFVHISTDEVFGSLGAKGTFTEQSPYDPSSPYSASKAASDHLVRAWGRTYGLPVLITNCSNNYGPYQFPEKLIPLMILNAMEGKSLPVYGDGRQVRDWLHVDDHAEALIAVADAGQPGETYAIGARSERANIDIVHHICTDLDRLMPERAPHARLIKNVQDRPGHDRRYAIEPTKLEKALGWRPKWDFETGLSRTIEWYLAHENWWAPIRDRTYAGERLGLTAAVT